MTISTQPITADIEQLEEEDVDVSSPDSTISAKPSNSDFIAVAMQETGESGDLCAQFFDWMKGIVETIDRHPEHDSYHPGHTELTSDEYKILDTIMPHDQVDPAPGSAHDILNQLLVTDTTRVGTLVHHQVGDQAKYCAVSIKVHAAG